MSRPHYDAPTKVKVKGAAEFMRAKGIDFNNTDLFEHFNISRRNGYHILKGTDRRRGNEPSIEETRGPKRKPSDEDPNATEGAIDGEGLDAR
jgi:hypothetical protein